MENTQKISKSVRIIILLFIIATCGQLGSRMAFSDLVEDYGNFRQIILAIVAVVGLLYMYRIGFKVKLKKIYLFHFLLLIYFLLSLFWSKNLLGSFSRIFGLFALIIVSLIINNSRQYEKMRNYLVNIGGFIIFTCLLFSLTAFGWMNIDGVKRFAGWFTHPNQLGAFIGLYTIYVYYQKFAKHIKIGIWQIITSPIILIMTQSRNAIGITIIILTFMMLKIIKTSNFVKIILLFSSLAIGILLMYGNIVGGIYDSKLSEIFRPETIGTVSGRSELWTELLPFIREEPIIGYGYGAFWRDKPITFSYMYSGQSWSPGGSHNIYLDSILNGGCIGLVLLILSFMKMLNAKRYITIIATTYIMMTGLFESIAWDQLTGVWSLYFIIIFLPVKERYANINGA